MHSERPRILSLENQFGALSHVSSFESYRVLYNFIFNDRISQKNDTWLKRTQEGISDRSTPDYWKLLGFNAMLGAQFGYDVMNGQYIRHCCNRWQSHMFSIPHQVAL